MIRVILLSLFLIGCSQQLVPETANQALVIGYSQITTLAFDANEAYKSDVITAEQHAYIYEKLEAARLMIRDGEDVGALLGEVVGILK